MFEHADAFDQRNERHWLSAVDLDRFVVATRLMLLSATPSHLPPSGCRQAEVTRLYKVFNRQLAQKEAAIHLLMFQPEVVVPIAIIVLLAESRFDGLVVVFKVFHPSK